MKRCRNTKLFSIACPYIKTEYKDVRAILLDKYLFTERNRNTIEFSMEAVLVSLLLTANRNLASGTFCKPMYIDVIVQKTQTRNELAVNSKWNWQFSRVPWSAIFVWKRIIVWNLCANPPKYFESIRFYKNFRLQSRWYIFNQSHQ